MTASALEKTNDKNLKTGLTLMVVAAGMIGAAYAAVPLYQMFCQATGFGGTTQVATSNPKGILAQDITVHFDSNVEQGLPWRVTPAMPVTGRIGAVQTIKFVAHNNSSKPLTGQAIFNVSPELAGIYFNKIECFCFTQQTLQPGETVEMPVIFFVDPDIVKDADLKTVHDLTLSYTFYAVKSEGS